MKRKYSWCHNASNYKPNEVLVIYFYQYKREHVDKKKSFIVNTRSEAVRRLKENVLLKTYMLTLTPQHICADLRLICPFDMLTKKLQKSGEKFRI
jgi:hypothetical protein